jgi:hypothetical protein
VVHVACEERCSGAPSSDEAFTVLFIFAVILVWSQDFFMLFYGSHSLPKHIAAQSA